MTTSFSTFLAEIFDRKPKRVRRVKDHLSGEDIVWSFDVKGLTYYITIQKFTTLAFPDGYKGSILSKRAYQERKNYSVVFELDHPEEGTSYHSTGTGNAADVLNTVSDTVFKYFNNRTLKRGDNISFLVDEASKGREALYKRFADRLAVIIGGAKVSFKIDAKGSGGFTITKS